jgi:hypothetical protein
VNAGSALQCIHFQPGIVGDNKLSGNVTTIAFGLLPCIRLEGVAILDHRGQGNETGYAGDFDAVPRSRARKVA